MKRLGEDEWNILEYCVDPERTLASSDIGKILLKEMDKEKARLREAIEKKKNDPAPAPRRGGRRGAKPQRKEDDEEEDLRNFPKAFLAYYACDSEAWKWIKKEVLIEEEITDCMDGFHSAVSQHSLSPQAEERREKEKEKTNKTKRKRKGRDKRSLILTSHIIVLCSVLSKL